MPTGTDKLLQSQSDKFEDAARAVATDEDEARLDEQLKKIATAEPAPEKPD